ncbi:HAMP domain-containing histidine kinase, partial [Candidatus Pelagibacter sp.]|nr:HAMP domain-containing histidine kinase [Candidatus Pelagibacter sp.]
SKRSRFPYFEKLDRVIFFDDSLNWIGDTRSIPSSTLLVEELTQQSSEDNFKNQENKNETVFDEDLNKYYLSKSEKSLTNLKKIQEQFFVFSIMNVNYLNNKGYILISENADNIIAQIEERENFIIRTAFVVLLVILIFSYVLNRYFLKPIKNLVTYTKIIKDKSNEKTDIERVKTRNDELGILSRSLDEMTSELNKRIATAENYSTDLLHEIRNPLASLKSASEIISETDDKIKSEKLINIISHDVERIERLITDYSQMLKDEAVISKETMKKIDIKEIAGSVVDDFNNIYNSKRKIQIKLKSNGSENYFILGINNRIEQIIANLLENSISFSDENQEIVVEINKDKKGRPRIVVIDEGTGFNEKDTAKIFNRFYSNRPENFGEHSGLGLNIVKNLVDLHNGQIKAENNKNKGAKVEIIFPATQ